MRRGERLGLTGRRITQPAAPGLSRHRERFRQPWRRRRRMLRSLPSSNAKPAAASAVANQASKRLTSPGSVATYRGAPIRPRAAIPAITRAMMNARRPDASPAGDPARARHIAAAWRWRRGGVDLGLLYGAEHVASAARKRERSSRSWFWTVFLVRPLAPLFLLLLGQGRRCMPAWVEQQARFDRHEPIASRPRPCEKQGGPPCPQTVLHFRQQLHDHGEAREAAIIDACCISESHQQLPQRTTRLPAARSARRQ
jgi:hypothetical protein